MIASESKAGNVQGKPRAPIVPESKRCATNRHILREGGRRVIRTPKPNARTPNGQR